jgi:hypothetical protein
VQQRSGTVPDILAPHPSVRGEHNGCVENSMASFLNEYLRCCDNLAMPSHSAVVEQLEKMGSVRGSSSHGKDLVLMFLGREFGDRDIMPLAECLIHDTLITKLHLDGNSITSRGAEFLARALKVRTLALGVWRFVIPLVLTHAATIRTIRHYRFSIYQETPSGMMVAATCALHS